MMITYPTALHSEIGKIIKALRESIGYSPQELADYLDLPLEDIKAYEKGDKDISLYSYLTMTQIIPEPDKIKAYRDYYTRPFR